MKKIRISFFLALLGICVALNGFLLFANSSFQYTKPSLVVASMTNSPEYEFDTIPVESCKVISSASLSVYPGQSIGLNVQTIPSYAVITAKDVNYKIVNGNKYAHIEGDTLIISKNANIGVEISVIVNVDGVDSSNILTFSVVAIPVQKIEILNTETVIMEGGSLKLIASVLPENASNKEVTYSIVSGTQYATVWGDGTIKVNNKLLAGNLAIVVRVQSVSDNEIYVDKKLSLYVPTKSLTLSSNNFNPCVGDDVDLLPIYSSTASSNTPIYTILDGAEYVDSFVDNTLKIKNNINVTDPRVKIICSRDGYVSNAITLNITVPIEKLNIIADKNVIKQGETIKLNAVTIPSNATRQGLTFQIISGEEATITPDGYLTALVNSNQNTAVKVVARLDNVVSGEYEILVNKPDFNLLASTNCPAIDSVNGTDVELSVVHTIPNASTPIYSIISGEEFGVINDNILHINCGLKDINPQIVVRAQINEFESNDLTIDIKILAEEVVFAEDCVDEVEQQRSYVFTTYILPTNATLANSDIDYTLNVDDTIATITEFGVLEISENAPIGTIITITAIGPDGAIASHNVTVKPVYAEKISIYETRNKTVVRPGSVLNFNAVFSGSNNISECVKQYSLRIDGYSIASVDGETVTVYPTERIEQINPRFSVVAVSVQGNIVITDVWEVEVYIPVVELNLSQKVREVNEGNTVLLSEILDAQIYPINANSNNVKYSIADGSEYARIVNNHEIIVNNDLPNGNLTFTICATIEGVTSNTVTFVMYVATKTLMVDVDKDNPMSLIAFGEKVNIFTTVDSRATDKQPNITVTHGADLISNLTSTGFEIKPNLRSINNLDKKITLKVARDGIVKIINVTVYIPVEELSFVAKSVTRGTSENLITVVHNANDDYCGFKIVNITKNCMLSLTTPMKLTVPESFNAGTPITINCKSLDRLGKEFSITLYVDAFSQNEIEKFTYDFGCDSDGVLISQTAPQLANGCSATIKLRYNGKKLVDYGILMQSFGIDGAGEIISLIGDDIVVQAGTNGKSTLKIGVVLKDGTYSYPIEFPAINIFNPVNFDELKLKITESDLDTMRVGDKVSIIGWNNDWTVNIEDLVWDNIASGTITSGHEITNTAPSQNFMIQVNLTNKQKYNGQNWETLVKQDSIKQFNFTGIEYRDQKNRILLRTWKKYILGRVTQITLEGQLADEYYAEQTQWVDESNNRYNIYGDFDSVNRYYHSHGEKYSGNADLVLTPHFSNLSQSIDVLGNGEHTISRDWVRGEWFKINLELQLLKNLGFSEVQFYWEYHRCKGNSETQSHICLDYRYNDYGDNTGSYGEYTHNVLSKDVHLREYVYFWQTTDTLLQNGLWIRGCYIDEKKNSWKEGKIFGLFGGNTVYANYTISSSEITISVRKERGEVNGGTKSHLPDLRPMVI